MFVFPLPSFTIYRIMDFASSSYSRTILDRKVSKGVFEVGVEESLVNLNGQEISNLSQCNSFDFMNEDEIIPDGDDVPREPLPLRPNFGSQRECGARRFQFREGRIFRRV